ncbi:MAG: serine hydrolase [Bacillota bacterium]|nr:serine hydrolase [Bacillota bacterium]
MNKKNKLIIFFLIFMIIFALVQKFNSQSIASTRVQEKKLTSMKTSKQVSKNQDINENSVKIENYTSSIEKANKLKEQQDDEKRQQLEREIKTYLGDNVDKIGLSYFDINSGKQITINGDKTFLAGSTLKVQMNMVLFDMIKSGQVSDSEALNYTDDCYEEGTGILQGQDLTKPLPIMQLSDYSILHSDNIATNMIIKRIGFYAMRDKIDEKLGHATDHSDNYITANDETTLLKLLYQNSSNNPYYNRLIDNMKKTDFHDRIDLYLPQEIVAHKIGDYDSYVNDAGIIYTKSPYILSIYTNGITDANETIAHISSMIYAYQSKL